ncbi:hypothetical protein [Massilioclostridium coli]|uniref:hypothetical protein n=1 Tax=Massilioclostridium coli TaxID=1870991 RepID=UPI0022E6A266|nr:hypothetical protein [Massilioclostridium coli]
MLKKIKERWSNIPIQKTRYSSGRGTVILYMTALGIIVAGFLFFLTSNGWMETENEVKPSAIDVPIRLSSQSTIVLKKWVYSPEQKMMEIELHKDNSYLSTDYSYTVNAFTESGRQVQVVVSYNCDDFMVLHIVDLPHCKRIDLQVSLTIQNGNDESDTIETTTLSSVLETVQIDDSIQLENTEAGYQLNNLRNEQILTDMKIKELQSDTIESQQRIEEYQQKIDELTQKQSYQTSEESKNTQQKIEQLEAAITKEQKAISDREGEAAELQLKIEELEQKIADFE